VNYLYLHLHLSHIFLKICQYYCAIFIFSVTKSFFLSQFFFLICVCFCSFKTTKYLKISWCCFQPSCGHYDPLEAQNFLIVKGFLNILVLKVRLLRFWKSQRWKICHRKTSQVKWICYQNVRFSRAKYILCLRVRGHWTWRRQFLRQILKKNKI
jgi:hypothetical protein